MTEGLDLAERLGATFRPTMEATGADLDPGQGPEELAQRLAEQGRRLLPGIECAVGLVSAERPAVLRWAGGAGPFAATLVGLEFPRAGSFAGRALAARHVFETTETPDRAIAPEGGNAGASASPEGGVWTVRVVPLVTGRPLPDGRTAVGVLCALRHQPVSFRDGERRLIDDFAALANVSLQRATIRTAAERSTERLQLAVDLALDLAGSLDPAEVVARLVRRAAVASGADRAVLLRVEGGVDGTVVVEDYYDVADVPSVSGSRQPVRAHEPTLRAIEAGRPVLDVFPDPSLLSPAGRQGVTGARHSLAVPLVTAGEVVAVLMLYRRGEPGFGSEELETLLLLGGPAGLALRNSFLFARVDEASRVKSDFLDLAAHELRAPLSVIIGYLSMLREGSFGPAPGPWTQPLDIMEAKAGELRGIVDDLLVAARLETGRMISLLEPLDLNVAVERAAGLVAPGEAEVELLLGAEPVMIRADRDYMDRLLGHLVTNAVAFRREERQPARVRLRVETTAAEREAKVTVEDSGRGIRPKDAERVFERFVRIDDLDYPGRPGTGLGLYIARQLAERQGGRLELEWSEPGVGSRFGLWMPLNGR
jgi:signal transduction histidine kinase